MIIILVRHGQTILNHNRVIQGKTTNPDLNETGILEIEQTALKIKTHNYQINHLMASPLKRAISTAEIIKRVLKLDSEITINDKFTERDFGPYEGMDIKYLPYYGKTRKGYENNTMLVKRMGQAFRSLTDTLSPTDCVVVCSHSHAIKGLLVYLFDKQFRFDSRIKNGDYFVIEVLEGTPQLIFTSYNAF